MLLRTTNVQTLRRLRVIGTARPIGRINAFAGPVPEAAPKLEKVDLHREIAVDEACFALCRDLRLGSSQLRRAVQTLNVPDQNGTAPDKKRNPLTPMT